MRIGVLFSGGKDSCYALWKASKVHEIACLLTVRSRNPESYMFHTPNINLVELQSEAAGIPLLTQDTEGIKEKELDDLEQLISKAKDIFRIHGIVTGAIESVYQAARVQRICDRLGLWCFNPLWKLDQAELLQELLNDGFDVAIVGVFAYPFGKDWLGRRINPQTIKELLSLRDKYKISPSGEGGEIETFTLNAPFFKHRIRINEAAISFRDNSGVFAIKEAELE